MGVPSLYFWPVLVFGGALGVLENVLAGIIFTFFVVGGLVRIHKDDPAALAIYIRRLQTRWNGYRIGKVKKTVVILK